MWQWQRAQHQCWTETQYNLHTMQSCCATPPGLGARLPCLTTLRATAPSLTRPSITPCIWTCVGAHLRPPAGTGLSTRRALLACGSACSACSAAGSCRARARHAGLPAALPGELSCCGDSWGRRPAAGGVCCCRGSRGWRAAAVGDAGPAWPRSRAVRGTSAGQEGQRGPQAGLCGFGGACERAATQLSQLAR